MKKLNQTNQEKSIFRQIAEQLGIYSTSNPRKILKFLKDKKSPRFTVLNLGNDQYVEGGTWTLTDPIFYGEPNIVLLTKKQADNLDLDDSGLNIDSIDNHSSYLIKYGISQDLLSKFDYIMYIPELLSKTDVINNGLTKFTYYGITYNLQFRWLIDDTDQTKEFKAYYGSKKFTYNLGETLYATTDNGRSEIIDLRMNDNQYSKFGSVEISGTSDAGLDGTHTLEDLNWVTEYDDDLIYGLSLNSILGVIAQHEDAKIVIIYDGTRYTYDKNNCIFRYIRNAA